MLSCIQRRGEREACHGGADFVAGAALCEPRSADFIAGTVLSEPQSADFGAGTAVCENLKCRFRGRSWQAAPQSADFVAGAALCDLGVQISWQAQHFVNLEVQIS